MSRRGRNRGSAISLFSFQDIITSVTAIMILLVLILTLELITRSQSSGVRAEDQRVARQLTESIESMEQRAAALRKELGESRSTALAMAAFSAADVRQREQDAAAVAAALADEIRVLESQVRSAQVARRRSEAELLAVTATGPGFSREQVDATRRRAAEIAAANQQERRRQEAASRDSGLENVTGGTLVFNPSIGSRLTPILLEVSGDGLTAIRSGEPTPERLGRFGRRFLTWLGGLDADREYVVIVLRPSGIDDFDDVYNAIRDSPLDVGTELIGEGMSVIIGGDGDDA